MLNIVGLAWLVAFAQSDTAQKSFSPAIFSMIAEEAQLRTDIRQVPGVTIALGTRTQSAYEAGFGRNIDGAEGTPVSADSSMYDLASLTKVIATTSAVMVLYDEGKITLDAPVSRWLPEFRSDPTRARVTIRQLLTHTAGLPAGKSTSGANSQIDALEMVLKAPLATPPGERMEYSDVGFIVLGRLVEVISGESLSDFVQHHVFGPAGMTHTRFLPGGSSCTTCVPTARNADGFLRGIVHDPTSRALGGAVGNAGLFSTAHDLGIFARLLLNRGTSNGQRIFAPETVDLFTHMQSGTGGRALGWDTPTSDVSSAGRFLSIDSYGHTGFTGTSIWIDPDRGIYAVVLTNRVLAQPAGGGLLPFRARVADLAALALSGKVITPPRFEDDSRIRIPLTPDTSDSGGR